MKRALLFCIAFACGPSQAVVTPDAAPATPGWKVVVEHLDGALLSMWGSDAQWAARAATPASSRS